MAPQRAGAPRTLTVDGEVSCPQITDDRTGPVAALLDAAAPRPAADHGTVHSGDGLYTASIPLDALRRGELDDGRLRIRDGRTLCWNVKDVARIELTVGHRADSVPDNPPH